MDDRLRDNIASLAQALIGTPYVWGGSTPYVGLDCSGFVIWIFRVFGLLPQGDWTTQDLSRKWELTHDLSPGNLIFYGSTDNSITHVAICLGGQQAISARGGGRNSTREKSLSTGASVKTHQVHYRKDFRFIVDISKPL